MSTRISAQEIEVSDGFIIDQWDIEDGLPANSVADILQSENGYLWLATFNGLVRFDGLRIKTFQTDSYSSMPSNRFNQILEANDGTLWLKTEQRYLVRFQDELFERIDFEKGLGNDFVNYLHKDKSGVLWFSTDSGITRYDGNSIELFHPELIDFGVGWVFPLENGELWFLDQSNQKVFRFSKNSLEEITEFSDNQTIIQSIISDETGIVYIAVGNNIYSFQNDQLVFHSSRDINVGGSGYLGVDQNNKLWVYTIGSGVFSFENNEWIKLTDSDHYRKSTRTFFLKHGPNFWIVTEQGLWLNSKKVLSVPNRITTFTIDAEGNLWLGTFADGLLRLKINPFTTLTISDGLPSNNVYGFLEDVEKTIWIGTHGYGSARFKNGSIDSKVTALSSSTGGYMKGFYQSKDSTIYAGSLGTSILKMEMDDQDFPYSEFQGDDFPIDINAFYEDPNNTLWVGGSNGLFQFDSFSWTQLDNYSGSNHAVRWFTPSPDSSYLWMATNGAGLLYHDGNKITPLSIETDFPSNHIRSLYISRGSNPENYILWVGSQDKGLIRINIVNNQPILETLTVYGTADGLLDQTIHVILEDDFGNFWFNTNSGIFRVEKEELNAFHYDEIENINGISYTEADGLLNREGNGSVQPSGIMASDGKIWFASQEGAIVFNPEDLISSSAPTVVIEQLTTESQTIQIQTDEIRLSKNERNFEIAFTALSLTNPEKNQYKYRLTGINESWQEPDILRKASYTNIPNGTYTFEVLASNHTGYWTPEPTRIIITIEPFYYETKWFLLLCIGFFGVLIYSFIQWRLSALRKNEIKLKELVNERTKELKEEKKITEEQALRLQELDKAKTRFFTNISHELRTPLTLIIAPLKKLLQSDNEFGEKTKSELDRMLRNSDRLLRLVDQTLELTRIEHGKVRLRVQEIHLVSFLSDLLHVFEDVAKSKNIDLSFESDFEESIAFADEDKLEKIIANLLSNAIKFTHSGGTISVSISQFDEFYQIKVSDTGIGIAKSDIEQVFERFYQVDSSETRDHEGSGIGLSLAKDFALLHKGDLSVQSEYGRGSTFLLKIPKGSAHLVDAEFILSSEIKVNQDVFEPIIDIQDELESIDKPSILIVEDNADLRGFLSEMFENNFKVISAFNGQDGLEKAQKELPDIIIADIMMPVMDGFSFNRELKKNPDLSGIPLIFLTAKDQKESEIQGFQEGADAYISKPFDPDILQNRVQNLLDSRLRLRKLLSDGSKIEKPPTPTELHPFLKKVNPIIQEHFQNPDFKIKQLSEFLFMDRSQVLRNMKSACGISPSEYLKKYRMEKARELLEKGEDNVSEIAYATGFNSLSYFSYSFKEFYKQSPSDLIQTIQNTYTE